MEELIKEKLALKIIIITSSVFVILLSIISLRLAYVKTQSDKSLKQNTEYTLLLEKKIKQEQVFRREQDSLKALITIKQDSIIQISQKDTFKGSTYSSKDLHLPVGVIHKIYPPKAVYRDLHKTKLYASIGDSIQTIVDLTPKQWLMLNLGDRIK